MRTVQMRKADKPSLTGEGIEAGHEFEYSVVDG